MTRLTLMTSLIILAVDVQDERFASGPIALQRTVGIVRFRSVQIRPL